MNKFNVDDRVRIVLSKPYTKKDIVELGCHPDVNGKYAKVESVEETLNGDFLYCILLDEVLPPHKFHKGTCWTEPFQEYKEEESSLEPA